MILNKQVSSVQFKLVYMENDSVRNFSPRKGVLETADKCGRFGFIFRCFISVLHNRILKPLFYLHGSKNGRQIKNRSTQTGMPHTSRFGLAIWAHSLTHSLTHSLARSLARSPPFALARSLTHPLTLGRSLNVSHLWLGYGSTVHFVSFPRYWIVFDWQVCDLV